MSISIVLAEIAGVSAIPTTSLVHTSVVYTEVTQDSFKDVPPKFQGDVIELLTALYGEQAGFGLGYVSEYGDGWGPKEEDISDDALVPFGLEFAVLSGFVVPDAGPGEWPLNNFLEEANIHHEDAKYLSMRQARDPEMQEIAKRINAEVSNLTALRDVREWWAANMDIPLTDEHLRAIEMAEMLTHSRNMSGKASEWVLRYYTNAELHLNYKVEGGY
jgi:hypothetical protein